MVDSALPGLIGGKYRPVRQLGQGGMSTVYVVEHVRTGEHLALKLMSEDVAASGEAGERFKREARASARIKSEHVVRIIDADVASELGGAPYLVMDLLEGISLEEAAGSFPVPPAVVIEWLRQVARGLERAHSLGIVHRDLKPENLFLTRTEGGRSLVKILDFGIAKIPIDSVDSTRTPGLLGTPLYMSPEQALGHGSSATPLSDLYSLGLIAFRLLAGHPYWTAPTLSGLLTQIASEPMPPPSQLVPELGPRFDVWFQKACHRDPEQRFRSGIEMVESLAEALRAPDRASVAPSRATGSVTPRWDSDSSNTQVSEKYPVDLGTVKPSSVTDPAARKDRVGRLSVVLVPSGLLLVAAVVGLLWSRSKAPTNRGGSAGLVSRVASTVVHAVQALPAASAEPPYPSETNPDSQSESPTPPTAARPPSADSPSASSANASSPSAGSASATTPSAGSANPGSVRAGFAGRAPSFFTPAKRQAAPARSKPVDDPLADQK
jgi:eukaryotic-like serine/threonine-protein kinase